MNCHTYLGAGTSNLGAPDLSDDRQDVEPRRRGVRGLRRRPVEVRQQRDAAVRRPRGGQPAQARHVPPVVRHVSPKRTRAPLRADSSAGFPRDHGRLRGAVRRAPRRFAGGGRVRGRALRVRGRDPGARDRAVRRPAAAARRGARALHRAGRRRGDGLRPARLLGAVRERVGARRRLRRLPVLDGDRGDDRDRG